MTKSRLPDPRLFAHLQWKQGMPTYLERQRDLEEARIRTALTGETIMLSSGLIVTKSSDKALTLPHAVFYATSRNGYLQTAELGMLVRDELDLAQFKKSDGTIDLDFSDQGQITSSLCLFHKDGAGAIRMYVSDLFAMYGSDRAKQQEIAEQVNQGITLPFNHELSTLLMRTSGNRNAILPEDYWPLTIPRTDLLAHPVSMAIFPAQSQRLVNYLQRKGYAQARFWLIGSTSALISDPTQCIIRPFRLGGVDCRSQDYFDAGGYLVDFGRVRWVGQKYFEATP